MTVPWHCMSATETFKCPSCSEPIRVKKSSQTVGAIGSFIVSFAAAYMTGAGGWTLLSITLILFVPFTIALGFIVTKLIGFSLEAVGGLGPSSRWN